MGFEDLERRLLESMSIPSAEGTPTGRSTASTGCGRQLTQGEIVAAVSALETRSEAPPEHLTLVAPTPRLAQGLCEALPTFLGLAVGFLDINILVNEHLPKRDLPLRQHKLRHGHTAYHKRIQKKWAKRFGTKEVDCWYVSNAQHLLEPLR